MKFSNVVFGENDMIFFQVGQKYNREWFSSQQSTFVIVYFSYVKHLNLIWIRSGISTLTRAFYLNKTCPNAFKSKGIHLTFRTRVKKIVYWCESKEYMKIVSKLLKIERCQKYSSYSNKSAFRRTLLTNRQSQLSLKYVRKKYL